MIREDTSIKTLKSLEIHFSTKQKQVCNMQGTMSYDDLYMKKVNLIITNVLVEIQEDKLQMIQQVQNAEMSILYALEMVGSPVKIKNTMLVMEHRRKHKEINIATQDNANPQILESLQKVEEKTQNNTPQLKRRRSDNK